MREHLSDPLILSVSHSGSMLLLSALLFDPWLMRVLDHQYSNHITWKRGKTFLFLIAFFAKQPKCVVIAKPAKARSLCCVFLLSGDSRFEIFYNLNLMYLLFYPLAQELL